MVGHGPAGGDEFVADGGGEGDVYQGVAVKVADFTSAEPIFLAAEAVGVGGDAGPLQDGRLDCFFCALHDLTYLL